MVGIILGLVAVALFGLLFRELFRPLAAHSRQVRERRATERAIDARLDQAEAARGASPERAVEVSSASLVEAQASGLSCVVCEHAVVAADHSVEIHEGVSLRVVTLHCRRCGHRRPLYVRIKNDVLH